MLRSLNQKAWKPKTNLKLIMQQRVNNLRVLFNFSKIQIKVSEQVRDKVETMIKIRITKMKKS